MIGPPGCQAVWYDAFVNVVFLVIALSLSLLPATAYGQTSMTRLRTLFSAFFDDKPSAPEPFGYKTGWIVVRSTDPNAVASALPFRSRTAANWHTGIDAAYKGGSVFVSPPVGGWVCIIGEWAAGTGERNSVQAVAKLVAELSSRFGEAQGYATHRVVEYHHWIMAKHGQVIRCFAYLGESGEVLSNLGTATEAETKLRFGAQPPETWSPSEEDVMAVASAWSFDPTKLNSTSGPAANGIVARIR
ncbi:hypothetical protein [uncultured Paludibaculum sp.]|uniref:hypothetical protein n=1 Tax=uncultured Paludibaculum sp. TaxID=1765020 RepID=UPI00374DE862